MSVTDSMFLFCVVPEVDLIGDREGRTHVHGPMGVSFTQPSYSLGVLALKVLVATIDAQRGGMGDVGSVRYEPALLPPCPTIRVLSYSN